MENLTPAYWTFLAFHATCRKALKVFQTIAPMTETTIKEMQQEIHQLRSRIMSLSATLLRKVAVESVTQRPPGSADARRVVREAEECFRCARLPGLKSEIAEGLEAAGHELMAIAVEIETGVQRAKKEARCDGA